MEFEFTLNDNDIKIVSAYGVLALYNLQNSGNNDMKIKDIKPKDLDQEILVTCKTRSIATALDMRRKLTQEK